MRDGFIECTWRTLRTGPVALCAGLFLAACSSVHVRDVTVASPKLPPPVVEKLPLSLGIHFTEAFNKAIPETTFNLLGETFTWRHQLGDAGRDTFRQALAGTFTQLVEVEQFPIPAHGQGLAAVLVPSPPALASALDLESSLTHYRQEIEYKLALHRPGGQLLAEWRVKGAVSDGFLDQQTLDQAMLRNVAADLVRSLYDAPAQTALRTPGAQTPPATATAADRAGARQVAALRIDSGLAQEDALEKRLAECVRKGHADVRTGPEGVAVRDATFPWLEPQPGTERFEDFQDRLGKPLLRNRLLEQGLTHLMLFSVRENDPLEANNMVCVAGYNAGACLGHYKRTQVQSLNIRTWDIAAGRIVSTQTLRMENSFGALGVLIPLPYLASNRSEVCEEVRQTIRKLVSQGN